MGWPAPASIDAVVKAADDRGRVLSAATRLMEQQTPLTPNHAFFNVQHFGPPQPLQLIDFQLRVDGHVRHPLTLNFNDLLAMPGRTVRTVLECSGNGSDDFPLSPNREVVGDALFTMQGVKSDSPARRRLPTELLVSAGEFTGVPLAHVLEKAGLRSNSVDVRLEGRDRGAPDPQSHGLPETMPVVDPFNYDKGLPLQKALDPDTILAWAMNGESLSHIHGAPVRLIVPGWSGNWSVKWIQRVEVLDHHASCWYQTQYYFYADSLDDPNREMITTLPVKSIITFPKPPRAELEIGTTVIRGLAWSGCGRISAVDVSVNGGKDWHPTYLEPPYERWMWSRWSLPFSFTEAGHYTLLSRATDEIGRVQPTQQPWNVLRKNFSGIVPIETLVVSRRRT